MKNLFLSVCLLSISTTVFSGVNEKMVAPNDDASKCFNADVHLINAGVGLGKGYHIHEYGRIPGEYYHSPAFSLSYEQPWPKRIGPGYLGVGAYLGYETERYTVNYTYPFDPNIYHYDYRWNHIMVTGRAAYHWDVLNSKKAEVYAGVLIGVRFNTNEYDDNDPSRQADHTFNVLDPLASVFAGARYYFSKNIGVYAEVGSGISLATGGLTFKF